MNKRQREFVVPEKEAHEFFKKRSRRAFLTAGVATVAAAGGYKWMRSRPQENMAPWPERKVLRFNERIGKAYLSDGHLAPTYSASEIGKLRPNGTDGLDEDVDAEHWRLQVEPGGPALTLTLDDIKALPRVTQIVKLHCIEGWSTVVQWTGARFADFTQKYLPPGQSLPEYVYMETPDSNYYVGLDAKSAMHPQTLLCYERNGNPLEDEHGAPLRLVIPVKYGVKSIKRVGLIRYTSTRPADYWAEQGYDWYIGL
jgi:DMSO/TMAO reductase YedYZ molybdopterin-dependent catalytic subunit